ncbi:uncharacterized protein LOC121734923 isoform X1 [Aricia agestis]|uniref:uncharacterized protein LOC121734923 isoform X1 n=1 Tax=Aricia agestis TaxID=91739 RepID=UPI001C2026A2|nr:uncharacterized protein LOC121734923 isoform X1 [Aricia agestis]XP_041981498.1 uncharacterized protein LOC121734923 isoform X1 [Aricia agestis]
MRPAVPEYPVDRYLVQSNIKYNDLNNIINEDLWESEPALRPEDEKTLRKLHEMLRSTADDLKVLSGELAKQREHEIRIKSMPTPIDEEFKEKVHIEEVVNAKFFGHKIADDRNLATPFLNVQKNVVDGLIKTIAEKQKVKHKTTKGVQVNEAPVKKINYKNLVKSQTRVVQVNHDKENTENNRSNKSNKLNNVSRIGYSEYSYKYVEPKPLMHIKRNLQVQKLPKVNIRSELKIQNVLQLDILPDDAIRSNLQNLSNNNSSVFIVKHQAERAESNRLDALVTNFKPVASQINPVKKSIDRKVSKLQTCESSESTEHVASDISQLSKSQKYFKRVQSMSPITNKTKGKSKNVRNTTVTSLEEWRNKLNAVYGPSSSKTRKGVRFQSKTKNQSPIQKANTDSKVNNKKGLNNVEYIPYTKLTLGGVSLDEIEKEIPDLPDKKEMPLGPILEKILSSRENTISANSPKISIQNTKNILTTSDENLLKEVLDIQEKVSKSLQDEDDKNNMSNDENNTYADDFDDDKTDSSYRLSYHNDSSKSPDNEDSSKESKTNNSPITDEEKIEFKIQNETYTKSNSLSFKNSVDVFEYVHEIDTQDSSTQINLNKKMARKQTQTSPRTDKNNIQSIHNDLKSTDPLEEVENMFKLEKDFIKKLILEEYGDIFTKSLSKPSKSGHKSGIINENSTQKDTQTSPARMKSVMTSPTRTKTRTTSPFAVSKVDRHTSPIPATNNEELPPDFNDDISIILSSPRFSLRLPQTSRDVMSNLDTKPQRKPKMPVQSRKNLTSTSSSSVDEYSSSDISSWGQIERYRQNRKLRLSTTEDSSSPTPRRSELSQVPTKSEGEISFGQIRRKVRSKDRSEGEASIGEFFRRARKQL